MRKLYPLKDNFIAFISISENLENFWIKEGIPKEKSIALHDGFLEKSYEEITPTHVAKEKLNLYFDKPIITYTGTLHSNRKTKEIVDLACDIQSAIFVIVSIDMCRFWFGYLSSHLGQKTKKTLKNKLKIKIQINVNGQNEI